MTEEERKLFHQLLDKYLDEPQCIKDVGTRLIQYEKAEVVGIGIRRTTYRMIVRTEIISKEE